MSLFELQEWLGHRLPSSTQRYAKITPTKLMKSYSDAGYFGRNLRTIEVLIDQETVRAGLTAEEPWKFYDLGHGYCTYDFFDQCPHRMACAKCSFYMPKGSTMAALLEGKNNLLRMRQEIPLSDAELAALDDGVSALESLLSRLADVPTPAGPTPLQLRDTALEPAHDISADGAVVRMEPRETAYEKKAPFRSWASSENSFTEVPAGSDANCAVAVFPDQAICATFCTKSPAKLFSTSRIFVRPMA